MRSYLSILTVVCGLALASGIAACGETGADQPATGAENAAAEPATVPSAFDGMPPVGTRARCPVMGGEFAVSAETEHSKYRGQTYVFCCPGCKPQFDADPEKYI
jgi:YHS domain-containing protein